VWRVQRPDFKRIPEDLKNKDDDREGNAMTRHEEIQNAYKALGKEATFYDGMMTYSTPLGRAKGYGYPSWT
jgi:hypothetical protein